jgi:hypothetical protein
MTRNYSDNDDASSAMPRLIEGLLVGVLIGSLASGIYRARQRNEELSNLREQCATYETITLSGKLNVVANTGEEYVTIYTGDSGISVPAEYYLKLNYAFAEYTGITSVDALVNQEASIISSALECDVKGYPVMIPQKVYFPANDLTLKWDDSINNYVVDNGQGSLENRTQASNATFNNLPMHQRIAANGRGYVSRKMIESRFV